ncbi:MAG: gamma-glutamyltranspeptidase/glutathione hydrolase [Candidatus Azotimanducaceae bacterium]|jgi:gamma-glutamyltranspeptidase/glutathione hydrolase
MQLDWQCPYPSNRSPIFARNIVATSQPLATEAGLAALRAGGNAVDAAIATAITLTVVEPNNNGIGSDAFAIIWDGNKLHGLNASGKSPKAWHSDRFKKYEEMPQLGWDAVTVPGAVSAWVAMSEKFGNLPFEKLFDSAIHYAEKGYQVGPKTAFYWQYAKDRFHQFESFKDTFLPSGDAPAVGTNVYLPDHAASLKLIATTKGETFYRGALAEAMVADSNKHGGCLTMNDLNLHKAEWVETLSQSLGNAELHEIPPNGQGLLALIALGITKQLKIETLDLDSLDSIHYQIEAARLAYSVVERELADITSMNVDPQTLLEEGYLKKCADSIDKNHAGFQPTALGTGADTVYLTCADASGMMVSMIQSNYRGFGSGIVIPGTGISMQNRGNGFTLEEGHPNEVAGAKLPYHTIIPGFVMANGQPAMSFGVMGGHMQAQGHLQMMIRVFVHGQNPQAASDAPRWHLREDGMVCLEKGFSPLISEGLKDRGHQIVHNNPEHLFGGAQLIYKMEDGYCAGSDHRKEGLASGF